jgi:lipopolysaccharide biosynthesis regulator YciM
MVLIPAWICTTATAAAQGSLQDAYKNAEQLAATPAGVEQAVAGYQVVIETHLANEAVFDSALRQLARCYLDSGRGEKGIRFFMNLGQQMYGAKRIDTLRDIMNQFKVKYPDQVQKVAGQAAWGLTYGVTDEAKPLVEEGLLKALPQETNDYTRENELRALRLVATEKARPYLKSVVESSLETDKFKQLARDVLAGLERKP